VIFNNEADRTISTLSDTLLIYIVLLSLTWTLIGL